MLPEGTPIANEGISIPLHWGVKGKLCIHRTPVYDKCYGVWNTLEVDVGSTLVEHEYNIKVDSKVLGRWG